MAVVTSPPCTCSGAAYSGVNAPPRQLRQSVDRPQDLLASSLRDAEIEQLHLPCAVTRMFDGLRSR